jgi:ATP-dependent Clp protease ATP-binding subunit ClpC
VDFRNTIIIMTSNIGARDIKNLGKGIGFSQKDVEFDYQTLKSTVEDALKRVFNPEFLNRIDDVIVFHPLEKKHIFEIIDLMVTDLFQRASSIGISVELSGAAKEFLVERGYDAKFGARPLRRAIQKYIEDPMAEAILGNDLAGGDTILISYAPKSSPDELTFKTKKAKRKKEPEPESSEASDTTDDAGMEPDSKESTETEAKGEGAE